MLLELERNLDMLLGLIAFLSWLVPHALPMSFTSNNRYDRAGEKYRGKPVLSIFSHLAMGMVFDLRLDRDAQELPCRELNVGRAYYYPLKQVVPLTNRTNVERRAVLGCYIICVT